MFTHLLYGLFIAFYTIFVRLPLTLVDLVAKTYNLISTSLPQYLMFGIKPGQSFADAQLPTLFLRLTIISVFVFAILFVMSAVRVQFQKSDQVSPISVAMKRSLLGTLIIVGIPILLYLFTMIINVLMNLILGGDGVSIGQSIFDSLYDKKWASSGISFAEWRKPDPGAGNFHIPYGIYKNLPKGATGQIIFMGAFLGFGTLIPLAMGLIVLVTKVFQQFFLFIISPFIVSASVADDGKRMKQWMEMYAAKSYAILGMLIGMQILVIWTQKSVGWANTLNMSYFARFILMVGLIVGGAVSVSSLTDIVTSFAGESASAKESFASTKAAIHGGLALAAGGFGAVKAAKGIGKFAKNNVLTKGVKGIMGKTAAGRQFLENVDSKRRIKQAFKDGKIGLAERNEKLNALKDQKQTNKVNKMKLKEAKEKDLMLGSSGVEDKGQSNPTLGTSANSENQSNAHTSNASENASNVSGGETNSNNLISESSASSNESNLDNLSKKDLRSSAFKNGKEMEKASKEALRSDKQELKLDSKINKAKNKLDSNSDPEAINKATAKIKKLETKLKDTKIKKEAAIKRAQDLDKLQKSRMKFYTKDEQAFLKTRNTVSNSDGNVTAYKFKKLLEKENKGGK
ncbi:Hypothetical protein MAU_2850 [Metamycoplasma auris 15026]|uniref:Uncharacterized protein n=1 Tax=Metamycoplasma auris 15026 TaxID=1188233 RepID=N9TRV6_9BACT|nr:hypothetical protein [Metamycoplasma auris]ENY68800.1 Hypothetical protein MAU_2850 [Metamycoplasma auris 15026]